MTQLCGNHSVLSTLWFDFKLSQVGWPNENLAAFWGIWGRKRIRFIKHVNEIRWINSKLNATRKFFDDGIPRKDVVEIMKISRATLYRYFPGVS